MKSLPAVLVLLLATTANAGAAVLPTASYAIVIGDNEPPADLAATLPTLHFADDDAVRYDAFFARFAERRWLLTRIDAQTQRRVPDAVTRAAPPSLGSLRAAVRELALAVKADVQRGVQPVVYLTYSGHGAQDPNGTAFLALDDGPLTQRVLYDEVFAALPDALIHVLVDACHAEAVVGSRGLFDRERDAPTAPLSPVEFSNALATQGLRAFPRVGTLVATTADQESHEWSLLQSGIFTHEVLSGLAGAADVNGDGAVEYSELQAFVASANRDLRDPRAVAQVNGSPPALDPHTPLVSLSQLKNVAFLEGNPSSLGHFYIELDDGERYLDAHVSLDRPVRIAVPARRETFVVTAEREAHTAVAADQTRSFRSLDFKPRSTQARGSIENTFRLALFQSPFNVSYYQGFVDSTHALPVVFVSKADPSTSAALNTRQALAVGTWALGGALVLTAAITGGLALQAKYDFEQTTLQRSAAEAKARFTVFSTTALVTALSGLAAGVVGWFVWPPSDAVNVTVAPVVSPSGAGFALSGHW